jgi:enoyl-[acyl-carrier protein] reductase I
MEDIESEFAIIKSQGVSLLTLNQDALKAEVRQSILEALKDSMGAKGRVRLLLHSVAKGNLKPMLSEDGNVLKQDDFLLTLEAMAVNLYDWTKATHEAGLFAPDARVLSFTSEGSSRAWKNYAAVSAAKAALEAITRNIALEFAGEGIKANCIQAGVTDTASLRAIPGAELLKTHSLKRNPHKRLTTPEDVADVVYLMAKDEAAWINGAVIPVDGGEHIN